MAIDFDDWRRRTRALTCRCRFGSTETYHSSAGGRVLGNALLVSAALVLSSHVSGSLPVATAQVLENGGASTARIEAARWLHGCWELSAGARLVEEQWTTPRGGIMLGMGRTTNDGKLVEHEAVVLRETGDHLEYEAHPSGQPQAVFVSKELTTDRVVFENLA